MPNVEQQYALALKLEGVNRAIGGEDVIAIERIIEESLDSARQRINKVLQTGRVSHISVSFETDYEVK